MERLPCLCIVRDAEERHAEAHPELPQGELPQEQAHPHHRAGGVRRLGPGEGLRVLPTAQTRRVTSPPPPPPPL